MPRLVSTRVPTAWIHFLVAELRPLYALWYAVYSFFKRGELEVSLYGVFGVPATNECWFSLGYYDCAKRCYDMWDFTRCDCSGHLHYCQGRDRADSLNRTINSHPGALPNFVTDDGMWVEDAKNGDRQWINGTTAAFEYLTQASVFPQYFHHDSDIIDRTFSIVGMHWYPWYNYVSFSLILTTFIIANSMFLTAVGPFANLDGKYVRFCLKLEHGRLFRRMVIFLFCVCMFGFVFFIVSYWFYYYRPPSPDLLLELMLVITSCRAMLLTDSPGFIIDVEDDAFGDVRFNLGALSFHGCDESLTDLATAIMRRELDPKVWDVKSEKYVREGAERIKLSHDKGKVSA